MKVSWALIAFSVLVLAACTSEATALQCPDCTEIQITRVIDVDTFESPIGTVRLFGVDTP